MSGPMHLTDCGLPGIKAIPYGIHMCHFFRGQDDLAAALVPYFAAGLRSNERCIWITAPPLHAGDAAAALEQAGLDALALERKGALLIRDYTDWYAKVDSDAADILGRWLHEEERAIADGYSGLRITGNTSFVQSGDWSAFMDYEELLNREQSSRRIVTLCSYALGQCSAVDVLDVVRRHAGTLDQPDAGWQFLTSC
jgi:hypothetical protein